MHKKTILPKHIFSGYRKRYEGKLAHLNSLGFEEMEGSLHSLLQLSFSQVLRQIDFIEVTNLASGGHGVDGSQNHSGNTVLNFESYLQLSLACVVACFPHSIVLQERLPLVRTLLYLFV